jgi:SOS-response transcriptional repressor LexA
MAAAQVLDMTMDDLQVLVLGHTDRDEVDAVLWDPMPGGSGLLDQLCVRFPEIVTAAREILAGCPSGCGASCIDCLQTFRNGFYHKHLDRNLALARLNAWGDRLAFAHEIPPKQPSQAPSEGTHPVNEAERRLRHLLLAAGFEEGIRGEQLHLDRAIGTTTPDVIYRTVDHAPDEGVCIYLDGLSRHLHGNPATAERDRSIRDWLRNNGYEVLEIAVSDLYDEGAMSRHFRRLAGYLSKPELRERLRKDMSWYNAPTPSPVSTERAVLHLVQPTSAERYVTCLPLIPLKAAAGAFGDPQQIPEDSEWEKWVAVDIGRKLRRGMFVAQVVGKSMEPKIPDGSYCIFAAPVEGSRQGKIVLAQLRSERDPESGERYTIKRYESEKTTEPDGTWRHVTVTLHPLNRDFQPIVLTTEDEGSVAVIAELVGVLE